MSLEQFHKVARNLVELASVYRHLATCKSSVTRVLRQVDHDADMTLAVVAGAPLWTTEPSVGSVGQSSATASCACERSRRPDEDGFPSRLPEPASWPPDVAAFPSDRLAVGQHFAAGCAVAPEDAPRGDEESRPGDDEAAVPAGRSGVSERISRQRGAVADSVDAGVDLRADRPVVAIWPQDPSAPARDRVDTVSVSGRVGVTDVAPELDRV